MSMILPPQVLNFTVAIVTGYLYNNTALLATMIVVSLNLAMAVRPPLITGVADVTQSLNVAQTLSQARKVLQSHRHWMKTRTATVTPLKLDEEDEGGTEPPTVRSGWLQAPANRGETEVGGTDGEKPVGPPLAAWSFSDIEVKPTTANECGDESNKHLEIGIRLENTSTSLTEAVDERKRRSKKKKRTPHNSVVPSIDSFSESQHRTSIPDVFSVSSHSLASLPRVNRAAWTTSSHSLTPADTLTEPVTDPSSSYNQLDLHVHQEEISDEDGLKDGGDNDNTLRHSSSVSSNIGSCNGNEPGQLHSASTGTIIAIAPAPKHRTTSYRRHKHSKVGSERELIDSSDDDSKSDNDSPLMRRNNIIERQHHSYIADPTVVAVLPKKHQIGTRDCFTSSVKSKSAARVGESRKNQRKEHQKERERNEKCRNEEAREENPVANTKKQEKTTVHADVLQSEPSRNLQAVSSGVLLLEDAEDENISFDTSADSLWSPAVITSHELKPAKFLPLLEDVEEIEAEDGEYGGPAQSRHNKESSPNQDAKKSSDKSIPRSPKPQVRHERKKRSRTKRTTIEHLAENTETSVTVATQEQSHTSLESQNTRQELSEDSKSNGGSSDATEVELMASAQIEGDKNSSTGEGQNGEYQLPPLLKVKSTSSLNLPTDFKFTRKRDRNPPSYSLHCTSHTISVPSCPVYGTIQPSEAELVKAYSNAVSVSKPRVFSPTSSPSSQPRTELVDEGIQTNPLGDQSNDFTYMDNEFIQQTQSSQFSVGISDSSLEPGELHLAARNGNLAKIRDLLVKGYDVNGLDGGGYTPLMYCILPEGQGVQLHCADLLIRRGANLDHKAVDGCTALHLASYVGALSLIQLLLFNGANPDVRDCDGRLPFHWATKPLTTKPIAELLKYSASEVNSQDSADMTTLMWAAHHQNFQVLQYLLSCGADVEEKDIDGETAMHWSVHERETRCLELLLKPDMTYFKDHNGRTVMHKAAKLGCVAAVEIITALRHDTVYDIDKRGRTPLHYSAVNDKVDVCYSLLTKGADATQRDFDGKTALDYAREQGNEYAVALFTCHENSIADFTRMTRTMSHISTIARSTSFGNLANADSKEDNSVITETLSMDQTSILDNTSLLDNTLSQEPLTQADIEVLSRGSYLGLFPQNSNDPPRHFYFWVCPSKGTLCWSRSDSRRNKKEAHVYRVYSSPSLAVTARPDFSPHELHRYAFWLATDMGVLDLLAYTEEAYQHWIREFQVLAQQNSGEEVEQVNIRGSREYEREETERQTDLPQLQDGQLLSETSSLSGPTSPVTSTPAHNQTDHKVQPPLDPYQVM